MTRPLAIAVAIATLAAPSAARAASLTPIPEKPCYRSGEKLHILGEGFTASNQVNLSRDGVPVSQVPADPGGRFDASLKLLQDNGSQRRTYTATDSADQGLSASVPLLVSAVRVNLSPSSGPASRRFRVRARGFTTGRTLWAHVIHKGSTRRLKIGRLKGACHVLRTRKRLLSRNARLGVHQVQFDTFRRYRANRAVKLGYTIRVVRGGR
jgi:hypothetical protein